MRLPWNLPQSGTKKKPINDSHVACRVAGIPTWRRSFCDRCAPEGQDKHKGSFQDWCSSFTRTPYRHALQKRVSQHIKKNTRKKHALDFGGKESTCHLSLGRIYPSSSISGKSPLTFPLRKSTQKANLFFSPCLSLSLAPRRYSVSLFALLVSSGNVAERSQDPTLESHFIFNRLFPALFLSGNKVGMWIYFRLCRSKRLKRKSS